MGIGAVGDANNNSSRLRALAEVGMAVGLAAILLGGCYFSNDLFKAKFTRSEELTAPVADITGLEVSTNVGALRLEAGEVPEARIVAEIKVKARTEEEAESLAQQVKIVAEPRGKTLVVKPERPPGLRDNQLSVDFTITAPARLALDGTTNVGDIRTTGFTDRVKARADVGAITCTGLRHAADLHTNVGDIRAEYAPDAPAALDVSASTDVGSIEFRGPDQISARLTATADVGSIHTDRPLTVVGPIRQALHTSLGNGEGQISLRTNVGSIRIR
jgi:hypothetical protein